jgi:E3 ubiquitin-protein ligase MARCH6
MLERFRLRDFVRSCLESAFASLCASLGLAAYLLDLETVRLPSPAEASAGATAHHSAPQPRHFHLRLFALIIACAGSLFVASTLILHMPIRLGRTLLARLSLPTDHDFYCLGVGLMSTWALLWGGRGLLKTLQAHLGQGEPTNRAWVARVGGLMLVAGKAGVLLVLWLAVIPVMLGVLFELVIIVPARVPPDETPFISPYEAWALGLVFLKIWVRCVLLGVMGPNTPWRQRFERVRANGIRNVDFKWTLLEVVWPVMSAVADLLLTPYFLVKTGELAACWWAEATVPSPTHALARRYAYLWYLALQCGLHTLGAVRDWLQRLHDRIRDDQYLVGLELKNLVLEQQHQ